MAMGMSYQEYWYGDVRSTFDFVESYRLKKEQENERLWLQGMYFYDALSCALTKFGANLGGKNPSNLPVYPKTPYDLYPHEKTQAEIESEAESERKRAREYLENIVNQYKAQKKEPI